MLPPKSKKELHAFLGTLNYQCKFWPVTAEVHEPLWILTSEKADRTWYRMYQNLYDKAKKVVKKDVCLKFYGVKQNKHKPFLVTSQVQYLLLSSIKCQYSQTSWLLLLSLSSCLSLAFSHAFCWPLRMDQYLYRQRPLIKNIPINQCIQVCILMIH